MESWIGVDFDGVLAEYEEWVDVEHTGKPIRGNVDRVKQALARGKNVRVFTARAFDYGDGKTERAIEVVELWCVEHLGQVLPVTCTKDYGMVELWDDRAVCVKTNTDERISFRTPELVK